MQANIKRIAKGDYKGEINGRPFNVWRRNEREHKSRPAGRHCYQQSYTWTCMNRDWAFSFGGGESFRGYSTLKQAVQSAINYAERFNRQCELKP